MSLSIKILPDWHNEFGSAHWTWAIQASPMCAFGKQRLLAYINDNGQRRGQQDANSRPPIAIK